MKTGDEIVLYRVSFNGDGTSATLESATASVSVVNGGRGVVREDYPVLRPGSCLAERRPDLVGEPLTGTSAHPEGRIHHGFGPWRTTPEKAARAVAELLADKAEDLADLLDVTRKRQVAVETLTELLADKAEDLVDLLDVTRKRQVAVEALASAGPAVAE